MWQIIRDVGLIGLLITIIIWLIQKLLSGQGQIGSLKSQIDSLKEEKSNFKQEIQNLKGENTKLQCEINQYIHKDKLLSKFQFNKDCGIWKHKETGLDYCHKCLIEKGLESPLRKNKGTWHCSVCDSYYHEPQGDIDIAAPDYDPFG